MKSYIKFMFLGTLLLVSSLNAGNTNPKEEQAKKSSIEEPINEANKLRKTIEGANNGSIDDQNLVAKIFMEHPRLFNRTLIKEIDINKWGDLGDRVESNLFLLSLIINTTLFEKVNKLVKKKIVDALNTKYEKSLTTAEEIVFLGNCYYCGKGVDKKNKEQAVALFKEAAKLGHAGAMYDLGVCYARGRGILKDNKQAVKLYEQAAKLDNHRAMYDLGVCYYNGDGVDKNLITALAWYLECCKPNVIRLVKTRAAANITDMISLKKIEDNYSNLGELFKKMGFIAPESIVKGAKEAPLTLNDILNHHKTPQTMNRGGLREKIENEQNTKSSAHNFIADFAGDLMSFFTKITSSKNNCKNQSKNLNNNSIITEENPFKSFKIPTWFMLTNLTVNQNLLTQLVIDLKNEKEDSVFSVIKLGSHTFYNIGNGAVKLGNKLQKLINRIPLFTSSIASLIKSKPDQKSLLQTHQKFAESLNENLGRAFAKSAGSRNKDFAKLLAIAKGK